MSESGQLKLKTKRGQQKAALTRTVNYIKKLDMENLDEALMEELRLRSKNLEGVFKTFQKLQDELELLQEVQEDESEREDFEQKYFSLQGQIKSILNSAKQKHTPVPRGPESEVECLPPSDPNKQSVGESIPKSDSEKQSVDSEIQSKLKFSGIPTHLPQMKLTMFDGDYKGWVAFRDTFVALVDKNPLLDNIQKLYHLRSCLSKDALETIKSIPVNGDNYELSWKRLQERYERNQIIIFHHVNNILKLPKLVRESAKDLREFYNEINNNLEALRNLNQPVEHWDSLLIPIVTEKLDKSTREEWERDTTLQNSCTTKDLFRIIRSRCEILEKLELDRGQASSNSLRSDRNKQSILNIPKGVRLAHVGNFVNPKCYVCNGDHPIFYCTSFLKLTNPQRLRVIQKENLCPNCLRKGHQVATCKSESKCKICRKKHNTLLHQHTDRKVENSNSNNSESDISNSPQQITISTSLTTPNPSGNSSGLLSTAIIYVQDFKGNMHPCRALLDCGAMNNIITQRFLNKLNLQTAPAKFKISGIGQANSTATKTVNIHFKSTVNDYEKSVSCIVLDNITTNIPVQSFNHDNIKVPKNIQLADPQFNQARPVDILLGSEIFWHLLRPNRKSVPGAEVILQNTQLGWVLGGKIQLWGEVPKKWQVNCLAISKTLENQLSKFWELEENSRPDNIEKSSYCDQHFRDTFSRGKDGRFIVRIPFKENIQNLGNSRNQAEKRLYFLERRLNRDPELYREYNKVLQEYIDLGHMSLYVEEQNNEELNYYIPHLAVVRQNSLTTKVRVVFDASMKTDSGISLNDVQYAGPTIQNDLISLLIRFRIPKFVMTADICKMYRMVWLHPDDRKFHRILWRQNPSEKLKCYQLNTVTFGTAAAPYLAVRCLHQLADDYQSEYPEACQAIRSNFYVDDFLFGAHTEEELIKIQHNVSKILRGAGFELRKWLCNNMELCKSFDLNNQIECSLLQLGEKENAKTLGVVWNATADLIQYSTDKFQQSSKTTKRVILSEVAQIFDPLCLLGPKVVLGKIILQNMWQEKMDWDAEVPQNIARQWEEFRDDLTALSSVAIPRHAIVEDAIEIELHGFGDASQKAYGAAIYLRSKSAGGQVVSRLLCSRSRVAPLKQQTLPRLELCAAVLVAQLATKVKQNSTIVFNKCCYWTDSTITLAWIKACPTKWKTFVSNRVGEIQRLTKIEEWNHVPTKENPADILSRGSTINNLMQCNLWWQGPSWLTQEKCPEVSPPEIQENDIPEQRTLINLNVQGSTDNFLDRILQFNDLNKSKRVVAYCLRFKENCKAATKQKFTGPITAEEMQKSLTILIKLTQQNAFPVEYHKLIQNKSLSNKSPLLQLNPFLDQNSIMRVGGRIQKSPCGYGKRHPIIIPSHSKFSKLLFKDFHERYFHCGVTQLLGAMREHYWPIKGRNMAKQTTRNCRICFLTKPKTFQYQMGNLPTPRISPFHPFTHVGVDYAGPVLIKDRLTRGPKMVKAYICIFVCFSTKAVHLELVSDLTTQCFIACLRRFVSRRGKPSCIYSDNATNFKGARDEIKQMYSLIQNNADEITNYLANENISWKFIPARAPTFGGLWEAGVKQVKHHLRRVLGESKLNFEEYTTILCQIECILNSRPLCSLSSDPEDPQPLTPGHFLLLKNPMSIPDAMDYQEIPETRLTRYQRLQQLLQHFWSRWHKEYLSDLQQRTKWQTAGTQRIQIGDIVVVKDQTALPTRWPIARVVELHPGSDGVTRVVTIKLNNHLVKRPVSKLCLLPCESV